MAGRIEDYALLGDLQTAALVDRTGSIDWLCLPRFDSGACFAALLDDPDAGRWLIGPAAGGPATRRQYVGDTLVLQSEWDTPEGTVRLTDFMPPRGHAADVVRIVEGVTGAVPVHMELRLRFGTGAVVPWVRRDGPDTVAIAGPDAVWLRSPVETEGRDLSTVADFTVRAGEQVPFVLTYGASWQRRPAPVDAARALDETLGFWSTWVARSSYDGGWREAVTRSLVTLKALTYQPTGGIVAAVTTSLPESLGGNRNWDYRYCWLRDATLTLEALLTAGYVGEARAWREWLLRAVAGSPKDLQIMYAVDGSRRLTEYEATWLGGYEGATPVRIGNEAATQFQLDVYGEVLDGLYLAREAGLAQEADAWGLQVALMDYLEGNWQRTDNSLWEVRGTQRHFTHSKMMAWVAADRMARAAEAANLAGPVQRWRDLRATIHAEVCDQGYDADRGTFTQYYGGTGVDAALLLMGQVGFLPWDDKRLVGTVDTIARELVQDGFVLRYRTDDATADGGAVDGLSGREGAFLACSFWLADALHMTGRTTEGTALFERLLALRNDLGLLSEEYDPVAGRQVGNTPQAFSHVPLVTSAALLSGASGPARRGRATSARRPHPNPR